MIQYFRRSFFGHAVDSKSTYSSHWDGSGCDFSSFDMLDVTTRRRSTEGHALAGLDPDVLPRGTARAGEDCRDPDRAWLSARSNRANKERQRRKAADRNRRSPEQRSVGSPTDGLDGVSTMECRARDHEV